MAQINNTKKPPQFDDSNYPYWKAKMTIYIKSINRKVWKVVETKIEIEDPENPTASFKMKEDESVPEMFHRLQVLVNDLKALGEEVKDMDLSYKFLRCLPSRFSTLVTILVRSGLDTNTKPSVG